MSVLVPDVGFDDDDDDDVDDDVGVVYLIDPHSFPIARTLVFGVSTQPMMKPIMAMLLGTRATFLLIWLALIVLIAVLAIVYSCQVV